MAMAMAMALVLVLVSAMAVVSRAYDGLPASFIFGDSLVDSGNNNYLLSLSKADIRPNGIDFKPSSGQPTGRFTNGRTIADLIGEEVGQPNYAPPYLAPEASGRAILNGVNYASGGGGILNQTGRIFINRLGLDTQVDYFNMTRQQLDVILGKAEAKEFLTKKAIVSVSIGANDFLNNYLLPVVGDRIFETPESFIDRLIINLRAQLTRLYSLDARKFVVGNIGPIGCIPYQKTLSGNNETECVSLPNQLALQFNGRFKDLITELNENLPGGHFVHANVYDIVMELLTNYQKYGFKTASAACCFNGRQLAGIMPCAPTSYLCDDRSKYMFWDPYHPSEAANKIVSKLFVYGDSKYISPMNIRQLVDL